MEIILLERILGLGSIGAVVKVKNGFARNFLLPKGKALRATEENKKEFEHKREEIEKKDSEKKSLAQELCLSLSEKKITMLRSASEAGNLYGSVSARDIIDALHAEGFTLGRHQVILDSPVKTVGVKEIKILLHPEVFATISLNIARTAEEAKMQMKESSTQEAQ